MLSKLEFFEDSADRPDMLAESESLRTACQIALQGLGRDIIVTAARGGTLGVCFRAEISGASRFLKTHLSGARARANLAKEADILIRLYGGAVVHNCLDLKLADGSERLCLLMSELLPLAAPMLPEEAMAVVRGNTERLADYGPESLGLSGSFEWYLSYATRAIEALSDRRLLKSESSAELWRHISKLQDRLGSQPRAVCHGDFGPKNTMSNGTVPIAIDWEDAFWGIPGYDYLYWLTFMENRPFLHRAALGQTGLEPEVEHAILCLIVLLKSYLSVRSDAYLAHSVSIQTRIAEVLELA